MGRRLLLVLAVAAAYWVVGRLALLLAIPPGYATGVWPSAGVALAATLAFGTRVWPGVLLGSMLVNVATGADFSDAAAAARTLVVPAAISIGAAFQAVLGALGIRRWVGYPNALEDWRSIARFLAIGGPVACVVSATVGVGALSASGVVRTAEIAPHWMTWWIGDTIGAVLITPLLLIGVGAPREAWRKRAAPLGISLGLSIAVIVALFVYSSQLIVSRTKTQVDVRARDIGHALSRALDHDTQVLRALTSLFESADHVDRRHFARFARRYLDDDTDVQALEWIPRVPGDERAAMESAVRADLRREFNFTEQGDDGVLIPAGERSAYFPVYYVEPFASNATAFGFDLASNPARRRALQAAAESGRVTASERITLLQETGEQHGFLMFAPVYATSDPGGEDPGELRGFALAVFRVGDMVSSALSALEHDDFEIELSDVTDPQSPARLFRSEGLPDSSSDPAQRSGVSARYAFDVGGRQWSLAFTPTAAYEKEMRSFEAWAILVGGCAFSGLLGALILLVTGRAGRVERLVDARTEEIRAGAERLAALSARFQGFLDCAVNFIIITTDTSGTISMFNSGAEKLLGYTADEMVGSSTSLRLFVDDEIAVRGAELTREIGLPVNGAEALVARAIRDGFETREWTLVRKDGTQFPAEITIAPLRSGDQRLGFSGVAFDVSQRRESEAAMRRARDEALRLAQTKSEFLANMSHEIRTPMNGVIGMVQLLEGTQLDAEQRDYLSTVRLSSEALIGVINDILDFSKLEAGKLSTESIAFDLHGLVADATGIMRVGAGAKKLELATDTHADVPRSVRGDPLRLRQILLNLLGNAVKFTESGQIVMRTTVEEQTADGVLLRFEVEDTGIGVDEESQRRIFAPFSQEDASVTRKFGGTGLGLAITKRLVDLLGGAIGVTSQKGRGSQFWFTLPFSPAPTLTPSAERDQHDALRDVRVLVVDDNQVNRIVLLRFLERWDIAAVSVSGGREALDALEQSIEEDQRFDVIVADIQMPGMSGIDLIRRIRAAPEWRKVKILVLTSTGVESRQDALDAGADLYLLKPIGEREFFGALHDVAGSQRESPAHRAAVQPAPAPMDRPASTTRLLVAEDNVINQKVLRAMLESLAYRVDVVEDGRQAVDEWRKGGYAAVLMDCQMPVLDGYSATQEIREIEGSGQRTPIIAVTAHAWQAERDRATAAGMDAYITKPFQMEELAEVLEQWLSTPPSSGHAPPADDADRTPDGS